MAFQYPKTGFHFVVAFELFPQTPSDLRFQEVTGLKATVQTGAAFKDSESALQVPTGVTYDHLTLKRGLFTGSAIRLWCINAIENFVFQPTNLTVMLLDSNHLPSMGWYVLGAYPLSWEVSGFNAERSELMIESITLKYSSFKSLSLEALLLL
ncbi:MAG: phage tail protein [Bacteroidota bacterium]